VPLIGIGQSFEPTPCECAKYFVATFQLQGFKDRKDLGASEIKTLDKLEEKYSNCEKYERLLTGNNDDVPIFQDEFVDCILDDTEYSDLCKCTYMIGPAILEALIIAFNEEIDDAVQNEREKFWDKKIDFCQSYLDIEEKEMNFIDERESKECDRKLLNEVLGHTTQGNKKETNKSHSNNTKKVSLYGEINDPDGYTNVREDKSSKSDILFKVYKNKRFKIIDNSRNWWLIEYNGQQGYMYKDRIDVVK